MKNIWVLLAVVIPLAIFGGILYLIWEVWHIFGFWRVVGLGILLIVIQVFAGKKSLKREEVESGVIYAPKELPIYIGVLCGFGVVGYLYSHLQSLTTITDTEYKFGIAYLILNGIQILRQCIADFRNRHDKVEVNSDGIFWIDIEGGKDVGQKLSWSDIKKVSSEIGKIVIETKGSTKHELVPSQMNMALFQTQLHEDLVTFGKEYGDLDKEEVEEEVEEEQEALDMTKEEAGEQNES